MSIIAHVAQSHCLFRVEVVEPCFHKLKDSHIGVCNTGQHIQLTKNTMNNKPLTLETSISFPRDEHLTKPCLFRATTRKPYSIVHYPTPVL